MNVLLLLSSYAILNKYARKYIFEQFANYSLITMEVCGNR